MNKHEALKGPIMSMRHLACLATLFSLLFCGPLLAQEHAGASEMKRLQTLMSVINGELKADLDQILVLQEAIKANARLPLAAQGRSPDAISFDEVAAAQRRAIQRESALNARLEAIMARSAILDANKQSLLERLMELGLAPQVPAAIVADKPK